MMPPMASKQDKLDHLRNVPLFAACSAKDLAKIAKAADEIDRARRPRHLRPGSDGPRGLRDHGRAPPRCAATARRSPPSAPGAVVGELSLLDRGPRTATVTADTDVDAARHRPAPLRRGARGRADAGRKIMAVLAGRIRDFDRTIYG